MGRFGPILLDYLTAAKMPIHLARDVRHSIFHSVAAAATTATGDPAHRLRRTLLV
jgi:hypothetical protein